MYKSNYSIAQGDQVDLPFMLITGNQILTIDDIDAVEITLEEFKQFYIEVIRDDCGKVINIDGNMKYDSRQCAFIISLNQRETQRMIPETYYATEIRIKLLKDNLTGQSNITGYPGPSIYVRESLSRSKL